jgi:hypothetical protein
MCVSFENLVQGLRRRASAIMLREAYAQAEEGILHAHRARAISLPSKLHAARATCQKRQAGKPPPSHCCLAAMEFKCEISTSSLFVAVFFLKPMAQFE